MFERQFDEMTTDLFVENGMAETLSASNVGLGSLGLAAGFNHISSSRGLEIIHKVDSMRASFPKYLVKRIRAFRNGLATSFGPDMVERVGLWR
ncbi:MAG TPA: hypothetical protein PKW66_19245 [Polyangiaceae bacterium]|nr:hypothetical protein [Polyangiaceae bacterium]